MDLHPQLPAFYLSKLLLNNSPPTDLEMEQIRQLIEEGDGYISRLDNEIRQAAATQEKLFECQDTRRREVRALRALVSPVRRFPPEILSEIFLSCLEEAIIKSSSYSSIDISQPPLLLGRVCSAWRRISLTTPRLWTNIRLSPTNPVGRGVVSILELFIERSRSIPLCLDMNIHSGQYIGTPLTLVWSLSRRLEDLQLKVPVAYLQPLVGLPDHMFPALRSLDIHIQDANLHALPRFVGIITAFAGAPCLRSLKLAGSVEVMHLFSCQFPWAQLTGLRLNCGDGPSITRSIVSQCVNLETCSITLYDSIMSEDALPIVNSVLPNLRTLSYDGPGEDGDEDQEDYSPEFFKSLSFPQLQVLSMDTSPWSAEVLVELHQRSTFELTTLTLGRLNLSSDEVVEFFSLIPTLKGLILNHGRGLHDDLFAALTYSNAHPHTAILPELEALTIKTGPSSSDWIEDPVAVAILDGSVVVAMLESRWWPDPAPGPSNPSAPRPAISRLKQTTLQFTHDSFMNFDQRVKAKLDVMVSAGMLNYYWVV